MTLNTVNFDKALCVQSDLDFFSSDKREVNKCKALCKLCPERLVCLSNAVNEPDIYGVWGGVDETEIRRDVQLDAGASPATHTDPPRCPNCSSQDYTYQGRKTRDDGRIKRLNKCDQCSFTWWIFNVPKNKVIK